MSLLIDVSERFPNNNNYNNNNSNNNNSTNVTPKQSQKEQPFLYETRCFFFCFFFNIFYFAIKFHHDIPNL